MKFRRFFVCAKAKARRRKKFEEEVSKVRRTLCQMQHSCLANHNNLQREATVAKCLKFNDGF